MVRLTERRSSARSAPISYTPPVKPPPPRTSAVLERRLRRRAPVFDACCRSLAALASSSTTLPMRLRIVRGRSDPGAVRDLCPRVLLSFVVRRLFPFALLLTL